MLNQGDDIQHLHVICYKWGDKYSAEYVNILRAMVVRNLTVLHTFHCITDSPVGLDSSIIAHKLPDYGVDGIWRKLMTFQSNFLGLSGEYVLSLDLDIVIVDNIDFVVHEPTKNFVIARNWGRLKDKSSARGSGSVYRLKVGTYNSIWDRFIADPVSAIDRYHGKNREVGEQSWLNANIDEFDYFPDGKVVSFKRHCQARGKSVLGKFGERLGLTTARWRTAVVPEGASVISFHGDPLPPDVRSSRFGKWRYAPFVQQHWHT